MIINRPGAQFEYEGTIYKVGGLVVGTESSEYAGLYGTITEIRDGDDRETENDTPDLYCAFDAPALPCEVEELEKCFSDLYRHPMKLEDISLDCVIMAPEMVQPLENQQKHRYCLTVYALQEDWAVNDQYASAIELYANQDEAKYALEQILREEQDQGCIPQWKDRENFVEESTSLSYECYIDGEYCASHYHIWITPQELYVPAKIYDSISKIWNSI